MIIKFESSISSNFGEKPSQNFPKKKGQVIKFGYLLPEDEFILKTR